MSTGVGASVGPLGRGLLLAVCLLLVHVGVWRPVRNGFTLHVAAPLVAAVETERAAQFRLDAASYDRTLLALPRGEAVAEGEVERGRIYRAPANLDYLLPALVLIALFPARLYWFWLWLAHLGLGLVALAAFALGVGWTDLGFEANVLVRVYLARAASVLALVLALAPVVERPAPRGGP